MSTSGMQTRKRGVDIKRQQVKKRRRAIATTAITAIFIISAGLWLALRDNTVQLTATIDESAPSLFSFDGSGDWWQGASSRNDTVIFSGQPDMACFAIFTFTPSATIDIAAAINQSRTIPGSDYTVDPIDVKKMTIQTTDGLQSYNLHQSAIVTPPGAEKIKTGTELGYAQLDGGYIKVTGTCDTPEQLPLTIEAIEAVRFHGV